MPESNRPIYQSHTIFAVIQRDIKPNGNECYYILSNPEPNRVSNRGHLIENEDSDPLWPAIKRYAYTYPDAPTQRVQVTYVPFEGVCPTAIITSIGVVEEVP